MAAQIEREKLDALIEQHIPFIIRTVSSVTGRYVSVEQDDAYSIGLSAFAEALERFDGERGEFLPFAGLVIRSRITTYLKQESSRQKPLVSLDAMEESGQVPEAPRRENRELAEEILLYRAELKKFGLSLEDMVEHSPRHRDTRQRAVDAAQKAGEDADTVNVTYAKKKLPIRQVSRLSGLSEKAVKTSKVFILGTMVVFVKKLSGLISWIRGTRWEHA